MDLKNYAAGAPSQVLYIKNLAKEVTSEDLFYVFGKALLLVAVWSSLVSMKFLACSTLQPWKHWYNLQDESVLNPFMVLLKKSNHCCSTCEGSLLIALCLPNLWYTVLFSGYKFLICVGAFFPTLDETKAALNVNLMQVYKCSPFCFSHSSSRSTY